MATRNRVIYQSEGLFVSSGATNTGELNHRQLERVQSANYSYTINRQDVNQYGELARIDSLVLEPPTVSVDFSYYLTDGFNERALGFYVQTAPAANGADMLPQSGLFCKAGNFASGHLTAGSGVNIYVVTSPEGEDFNAGDAYSSTDKIIGIGNCYVSDYSIDLSVGSIPTASVTMEGANVRSSNGSSIFNPAVVQADGTAYTDSVVQLPPGASGGLGATGGGITALRPGDITLSLSAFDDETVTDLGATAGCHIQSASISIPLSRTPLDRLGSKFAFARTVDFPVVTTLSVSAIMNEETSLQLADALEADERDVSITMKSVMGIGGTDTFSTGCIWDFKGALVESESWSSSIGANKTVDLTFSAQIGGPEDIDDGVFMSGQNTGVVFGAFGATAAA
jgi:hypothetical protein